MRFSRRFKPFHSITNGTIKSVTIEFQFRTNAIEPFSKTLFAAREVVRLGLGKDAHTMRWAFGLQMFQRAELMN